MDRLLSEKAVINAIHNAYETCPTFDILDLHNLAVQLLNQLPSAEPQIIYCKDCEKHNKARGYSYDGTFVGIVDACPLVEIRGKAQGHEFDYQYCVYAKRREDEQI